MPEPISRKGLVEMARCVRAPFLSDSPWLPGPGFDVHDYRGEIVASCGHYKGNAVSAANAEFIAASKPGWPRSVREVEMLRITLAWKMGWLTAEEAARMLLLSVADLTHYWLLLFG